MPTEQKVSKVPKGAKRPTDRQPKQDSPAIYEFEWNDTAYTLPPPDTAVDLIPGKVLRDAYMEGDEGQMRLGFAMLEHVEAEPGTIDALYAMPAPIMLEHIQAWMELRASKDQASVGESLRSLS
jgi:hypothetical protein